jgi:glutathione S-transferase
MKLYYSPGACSLSPHIALREAELPFDLIKVDTRAKKTADGRDFKAINARGYVPVLELDNGEYLTEGPVIVQYIADRVPQKQLAPENGSLARYRLQEWLNFTTSELHKNFAPLFYPDTPEEYKATIKQRLLGRFEWIESALAGKSYVLGQKFSVADGYLFTVTSWTAHVGIDISGFGQLVAYQKRVQARPAVQAALEAEGLSKK